jgi:hypothetical protein
MSLAVLADHMASRGRGPDSMLIHMSPREVQGLQALAMKHGGSLTINPHTGLPEAGFLDKLLPAIIGFGITAMTGLPAWQVGLGVGAVETARTGDLGKGISAGLGAYGGAGLGAGMTTAGADVLSGDATALAAQQAGNLAGEQATQMGLTDAAKQQMIDEASNATARVVPESTPFQKLSAGFDAAKANPSSLLTKDNFKYLAAAAAPVLADQAVKSNLPVTATKPGMIRPYSYDPYGGTYTAGSPYEATPKSAAEGGLMGMNNGGYSPGQLDFTQQSEPVVRMAEGGVPGYAGTDGSLVGGYKPTKDEIFNYFKTPGLSDAQIAADMQKYGVSAADIANATGTQGQQGNYEQRFVKAVATPTTDASEFLKATQTVGLQNQGLATAMQGAGLSAADQYALTHNLSDATTNLGALKDTSFYKNLGYTTGTAPGDQGGLEGLYSNINNAASGLQKQINTGTLTVAQAQDLALAEANRIGVSLADINAATGKTIGTLFTPKTIVDKTTITGGGGNDTIVGGTGNDTLKGGTGNDTITTKKCEDGYHLSADGKTCIPNAPVIIDWQPCATGYTWDRAKQACVPSISAVQPTTETVDKSTGLITAPATTLPVGVSGNTGASIIGGGSTVNPNGTITTSPVIPGIPVGGFTGMEQVRDAYEKGGGSLGVNKNLFAPKTLKEIEDRYKLTGGSKQAYDYLMGKTPYDPTPFTKTGEIMKPYWESVGRAPVNLKAKKYIFKDGKYELNPDYVKPSYVQAGEKKAADKAAAAETTKAGIASGKSITVTDNQGNAEQATIREDGLYYTSGGNKYDEKGVQVAAGGGLAALTMAGGGMSGQFDLGSYSDGGRLLRGPGDGVSDSIPATIGNKRPARLADGEFVVPARIVSELGNGSTEAGARKLYAMMDRVQAARKGSIGKGKVAKNSRADKYLPA